MANTKISALPSVTVPAGTDQFPVNQGGASKKVTLQQISGAGGLFNPVGTSRISRVDATNIQLNIGVIPLFVNSIWQMKPVTTVVNITNGSLSANTTYFVYAFDNAGTLTLEIVVTAHATDATYGVEIKSGDATRTLVGMVRTNASSQFVDTVIARFVISWFNRKTISGVTPTFAANVTTTSTTFVEMATAFRIEFLCWPDEEVRLYPQLIVTSATAASYAGVDIDAGTSPLHVVAFVSQTNGSMLSSPTVSTLLAEGYHFSTISGRTNATGTLTLNGTTATAEAACYTVNRMDIRG